jgi:hypothetical protein
VKLPSLERLIRDIGSICLIQGHRQGAVAAELVAAYEGTPMTARYCCYSAEFALPAGVFVPQSNCTLTIGDDTWRDLLLTPIGPDEDGRQLMQMVLHYLIPQAQDANASNT